MRKSIWILLLVFVSHFTVLFAVTAQPNDSEVRVSAAERSDKKGWVVRFHFEQLPKDYRIDKIENGVHLFVENDEEHIFAIDSNLRNRIPLLDSLSTTLQSNSSRFSFFFKDRGSLTADVYPDMNGKHLLLAFSYSPATSGSQFPDTDTDTVTAEQELNAEPAEGEEAEPSVIMPKVNNIETDGPWPDVQHRNRMQSPYESDLVYEYIRSMHRGTANSDYLSQEKSKSDRAVSTSKKLLSTEFYRLPGKSHSIRLLPVSVFHSSNSEIPWGYNDGALWQGRGSNRRLTAGVNYRFGPLTIDLRPELVYSENTPFDLSRIPVKRGLSKYAMPLTNIDAPVRFGEHSLQGFNVGHSSIGVRFKYIEAGLSNKHLWNGPALYNPLLFSNNAPGFRHIYLKTPDLQKIPTGHIDGTWVWGSLLESDYFDEESFNDRRYITSIQLSYLPDAVNGLEVGFSRVSFSNYPENGVKFGHLFQALERPQDRLQSEESNNVHMFSVFGKYHLYDSGFEIYAEWGKNEHKRYLRDMFTEPEVHRGYVLGILKRFIIHKNHILTASTEWTNLESTYRSSTFRNSNIWYTDSSVKQGFTNQGQLMGASVGPGSSIQKMKVSYFNRYGGVSLSAARVALHNDRHFENREFFTSAEYLGFSNGLLTSIHHIEMRYQLSMILFLPYHLELNADFSVANQFNRRNIPNNELTNTYTSLTVRYHINHLFK